MTNKLIVRNIGALVTLAPLAKEKRCTSISTADLGSIKNAWLAIEDGLVKASGSNKVPHEYSQWNSVDAEGKLVLPGLVDCHTHPIFGGDRSAEFAKRLDGSSYQEIAAAGGGIKSTIAHTRQESDELLMQKLDSQLNRFLDYGVCTVECKSGYGQSPEEELRMLKLLQKAKSIHPMKLSITYLGLHAMPAEYKSQESFVDDMSKILDQISQDKLADWVDAFVEKGYFEPADCESYIEKAKSLGLGIRIHADEFADSAAADAAARWGAASADHLEEASQEGIKSMAAKGVVAVLLPGTSVYSKIKFAQAKPFIEQDCAVALATDYNPGSCQIDNLPMIASLGALHCGLSSSQAIAAVSYVPAKSLNLADSKGHLSVGAEGDFLIHELDSKEKWIADFGRHKPISVFIAGKKVK